MTMDRESPREDILPEKRTVRVLLLDDEPVTLMTRATVLRKAGYLCATAATCEEALALFGQINIAVLDYHLGAGKFGSDVAVQLRKSYPTVPIIILSATLNHFFGGVEDMHLLKGYSSNDHLLAALQSLEAKRRGAPVLADANHFFYSRMSYAIGAGVLVQVFDAECCWLFCNQEAADYLGQDRDWFHGRSLEHDLSKALSHWQQVIKDVASRRETYIDRTRNGLLNLQEGVSGPETAWSIVAFPIALPDGLSGVVLTARNLALATAEPANDPSLP